MERLTVAAPAKINLTLDVLARRADGYHDLKMVMQSVDLCDEITLTMGGGTGISVHTDRPYLPDNDKNIAAVAARCFAQATGRSLDGLSIEIKKRIPVCAGTAGGSSDGAAVLRGLNRMLNAGLSLEELARMGEQVGADVPYCVLGGTALAEGKGERLTPLPSLPDCHIVLCKPAFPISTPELFGKVDGCRLRCRPDTAGVISALEAGDIQDLARRMYNVFEDVLPPARSREIQAIKGALIHHGALGACMSGTGPTVFGLFRTREEAERAWRELSEAYSETFLTRPVGNMKESV